jgi:hypothetical protein
MVASRFLKITRYNILAYTLNPEHTVRKSYIYKHLQRIEHTADLEIPEVTVDTLLSNPAYPSEHFRRTDHPGQQN